MAIGWLKTYLPRGLYGRAALILIVPVVVVQLVVSIAFIQRHFEDVTTQMTQTVIRELRLVLDTADRAAGRGDALAQIAAFATTLQLDVTFDAPPMADQIRWYDFSGRVMIRTLRAALPQIGPVLLPDNRVVVVRAETDLGPLRIVFDRRRVSASNPHQLLVTMVFFGGLMTVIAYLYLRNQLRPITRLADAAQAFGRGRHVPYAPRGAVEVRTAGHAFLDMRARIERQIEQRTLMLSGVSHDLRTPLTRLRLGLAMMDEEEAEPLLRDVNDMERLVDEFLSFAKGTSEGEPEPVDPATLLRSVVEDARRAGRKVDIAETQGTGEVMLRRGPIRRALENLIGNAVRYGSRAEVSMVLTDKSLRFRVEDDGPGIPEDKRGEAIKPFARLDPARNQDKGSGVGLGLAIATDIARAHGGVLRLGQSDRLGGLRADIVIAV
ncbi:ATP-binding protein [Aestuariivita sp.]|jgi:two-component system osmolarity sensor histidine kinase EnvZ|uniref:ATP-binding protein n=1 Tax=Aestuariivita sp. TaxID=1872407 RepID=UPI0021724EB8|nr:ATP-binding protein [Aestuariivita sp.]MCE8006414.1 HAMP domain-containing protein [Aestuariivita sp.]